MAPQRDGKKTPFSVEQARRDLRDAERTLKDYEKQNITGQLLDDARQAVRDARKALENMTSGSREDRLDARKDFMNEYYNDLGGPWIAELVKRDPELRRLFEEAIRTDDLEGFLDDVYQSEWWNDPKRSGSWKDAFRMEYAKDKTPWNDRIAEAKKIIENLAKTVYNMTVPSAILDQIARRFLYQGWDRDNNRGLRAWLDTQFGKQSEDPESTLTPGGAVLDMERQLRDAARDYGVYRDSAWFEKTARDVLNPDSNYTEDNAWNELITDAEGLFPVFAGKLSKDRSVRDLGAGYISQLSRYLEINDPSMIELSDPLLQRAFTNVGVDGKSPALMPLWEFTQAIKKDARWQYTTNALDTYSSIGSDLARMMGFVR